MPALPVGSPAPDFTLASQSGDKISLASYRGKRTVVSFLPFAFTGG
jgi:peroxiredoxin